MRRRGEADASTTSSCLARFWHGGIIGPLFLENYQGGAVTDNGKRYRAMFNYFVFQKVKEDNMGDKSFQQNSATCHTTNATINILRTMFETRINSCSI